MHKFRIAHLIYSKKVGGSEMVAANICTHLDRAKFDPMVLFMYRADGSMPEILSNLGIPCQALHIMRRPFPLKRLLIEYRLRRLKIDLLHVHHVPLYKQVARIIKSSGIKGVVLTEHAKFSISKSKKLQSACRDAAKNVDYFTTVSIDLKKYFLEVLQIPERKILVIHNGIDTARFKSGKETRKIKEFLPNSFKGKILINVGRLTEAKDHVTLLLAIKELVRTGHSIFLLIVGEGELRPIIERKIGQLNIGEHVRLLGSRPDIPEFLPQADIFVLSSKREGLPMVIMEAMASGLPVVSTNVGGISEVVKDNENGILVPPQRAELLSKAIEKLLLHPQLVIRLSKAARSSIKEQYCLEKTAESYANLYQRILL